MCFVFIVIFIFRQVSAVKFSRDGRFLVTGSNRSADIYDISSMRFPFHSICLCFTHWFRRWLSSAVSQGANEAGGSGLLHSCRLLFS